MVFVISSVLGGNAMKRIPVADRKLKPFQNKQPTAGRKTVCMVHECTRIPRKVAGNAKPVKMTATIILIELRLLTNSLCQTGIMIEIDL